MQRNVINQWRNVAEALEAKLAELEKQEPIAMGCADMARDGKCAPVIWLNTYPKDGEKLYTRPLPAPDLQKRVEELQARIAMQDEALKSCGSDWADGCYGTLKEQYFDADKVKAARSATSEDVAAWQEKQTCHAAGCRDEMLWRDTLEKQLAPLRRELAMLHNNLRPFARHPHNCGAQRAVRDTQATAEAYEKEVAAKALEEAAIEFEGKDYGANELRAMAAELRGETK